MNDDKYDELCEEFESYLVNVLGQHSAPTEVKMAVIATELADACKEIGMSEFQAINAFVSVVKQIYKED